MSVISNPATAAVLREIMQKAGVPTGARVR